MKILDDASTAFLKYIYDTRRFKKKLQDIHKDYQKDREDYYSSKSSLFGPKIWANSKKDFIKNSNFLETWTNPKEKKVERVQYEFQMEEDFVLLSESTAEYQEQYPKLVRYIADKDLAKTIIESSFKKKSIDEGTKIAAEREIDRRISFARPFQNVIKKIKKLFSFTKRNIALQPPEGSEGSDDSRAATNIQARSTNIQARSANVAPSRQSIDQADSGNDEEDAAQPSQPEDLMGRVFREIKWWVLVFLVSLLVLGLCVAMVVRFNPKLPVFGKILGWIGHINSVLIILFFALHAFGTTLFDVYQFLSKFDETRQHNVYEDQSLEKIIYSSLYFYILGFIRILYFLAFWYIVCLLVYTLFKYPFWVWPLKERSSIEETISNAVRETFHPRKLMRFARIDSYLYPLYFGIVLMGMGFLILYGILFHRTTAMCKPETKRTVRANRFLIGQSLAFAMVFVVLMITLIVYLVKYGSATAD